ncbi:MAG: hypothetical protein ACRD0G_07650, partial [Acidimicrobiales bacterium]
LRGPNDVAGLRGPNDVAGLRGPNDVAGLRGPNDVAGLRDPNDVSGVLVSFDAQLARPLMLAPALTASAGVAAGAAAGVVGLVVGEPAITLTAVPAGAAVGGGGYVMARSARRNLARRASEALAGFLDRLESPTAVTAGPTALEKLRDRALGLRGQSWRA